MNREELKKTLKPLIKQCIKEVLFEEAGVLSKVVTEVAQGLQSGQRIVESSDTRLQQVEEEQAHRKKLEEAKNQALKQQKERMLQSIGETAYNGVDLFEGTTPMSSAGSASTSSASPMGPMKNVDPNDPGVDLHSIPGLNMDVAKKLMG